MITHGLIQDKHGKKMSKSLGNVISPLEIVDRMGADILRLWFSSVDYTQDFRADMAQLDDARQAYKKLRNTLRFMLGNLNGYRTHDFRPKTLEGLDRYTYLRFRRLQEICLREFRRFEFHRAYRELRNFAVIDLSNLLLDVRKDRLYCDALDSERRRRTQSVLWDLTDGLCRLLAPIAPPKRPPQWRHSLRSPRYPLGGVGPTADLPETRWRAAGRRQQLGFVPHGQSPPRREGLYSG